MPIVNSGCFMSFLKSASVICAFCILFPAVGHAHVISTDFGSMGSISAIEWIDSSSCPADEQDSCVAEAEELAVARLESHMERFHCVSFSGESVDREISSQGHSLRGAERIRVSATVHKAFCKTDPEAELLKTTPERFLAECSRVLWKCNILWIPDDDMSLNFIGRIPF